MRGPPDNQRRVGVAARISGCGFFLVILAGGSGPPVATVYVSIPPSASARRFTQDLANLTRRHGLFPRVGQATDDHGHTVYVLDTDGIGTRLWSQNVPLSGHEDPARCGRHSEAYPDPAQFVLDISSPLPWQRGEAAQLASVLSRDLSSRLRGEEPASGMQLSSPRGRTVRQRLARVP